MSRIAVSAWALTVLAALASPSLATAQGPAPGRWVIVPRSNADFGMTFSLGWSLGTHQGQASSVTGSMQAQLQPFAVTDGEFHVPISAMSTGSTTRDCHMREALGIDYAHSHFPAQHVCVNDQVPASGPDSVVYPDIVLRIRGARPVQAAANQAATALPGLTLGKPVEISAVLDLSIHGVTRQVVTQVRLQLIKQDTVQAETEFEWKLADFGVVVIMPRLLKVDDAVKVTLKLLLQQSAVR
jgi:polyisoprenoid-binding protein YceI